MEEDFLTINTEQAAVTEAQSTESGNNKQDPNVWKPSLGRDTNEYEAKIRLLPQGLNGVKNKLPASVSYNMHYLKDSKHNIYRSIPCRKTLGEACPVCEAIWNIYNTGKDQNNKVLMELAKDRLPSTRHVINVIVRDDLTKPINNGKVLKWDHTDNINKTLMDPLHDDEVKVGEDKPKFKKTKEKFTPYSPRNGRDRYVIVERNPTTNMPSYANSYWDEDGLTDLADTPETMMAILDQCHDLSTYRDVPSAEDLMGQYNEFLSLVASKERNELVNNVQSNRTNVAGNTAAPAKNVSTGDASTYFENVAIETPVDAVNQAAVNQDDDILNMNNTATNIADPVIPINNTSEISDEADDDLPF